MYLHVYDVAIPVFRWHVEQYLDASFFILTGGSFGVIGLSLLTLSRVCNFLSLADLKIFFLAKKNQPDFYF
jgi:hypothetical protein